jgi:hypothetical protein
MELTLAAAREHDIESGRSALNGIRAALPAAEIDADDVRRILTSP